MSAAIPRTAQAVAARLDAAPNPIDQLRATAARRPDHPALLFLRDAADGEPASMSYSALLAEVERVAAGLVALGVAKTDGVALLLPSTPDMAAALIAASAVGVAFPMNPLLSAGAIRAQLDLASTKVIITIGDHPALDVRRRVAEATEGSAMAIVETSIGTPTPGTLSLGRLAGDRSRPLVAGDPTRVAALFHTGGTTGDPKLAQLTLRNLAAGALMAAAGAGWRSDDRFVCALPLFHVGGAIDVLLSGIAAGSTILFPGVFGMRDPAVASGIWSIIERTGATVLGAVPTSLAAIQNVPVGEARIEGLRRIATGGSPLASSVAARVQALTARPVHQIYGMTETTGIIAAQSAEVADAGANVGQPVPLMTVSVGAPGGTCEPGARGELFIAGPNVFAGYRMHSGVAGVPEAGWVATGDIAEVLPSGALRIVGRSKDVIIRSGHNIDPVAIEDAAASHPDVVQAGAVGMPDAYAGELPVLYLALRSGAATSADELAAFVAERIVEPPARPKRVFILPELPLTPFGKVARYRLRQQAAVVRAHEVLDGLESVAEVSCADPAARRLNVRLAPEAGSSVAGAVQERLAEFGLVPDFG